MSMNKKTKARKRKIREKKLPATWGKGAHRRLKLERKGLLDGGEAEISPPND